jgi:ribosomal protein S27E
MPKQSKLTECPKCGSTMILYNKSKTKAICGNVDCNAPIIRRTK